jgi:hypothetical protein
MARTPRPSVRKTAALADKAPTTPLMPTVVVQEEALPLADLATTDSAFAMRIHLRADALAEELKRDGQLNAIHVWSATGHAPYDILAGRLPG